MLKHNFVLSDFFADPKVAYFNIVLFIYENVVQFYISVENIVLFEMVHTLTNLHENRFELFLTKSTEIFESIQQILVVNILQHKKYPLVILEYFIQFDDELTVQMMQDLDFRT